MGMQPVPPAIFAAVYFFSIKKANQTYHGRQGLNPD